MPAKRPTRPRLTSQGFSLVEVLVAILVLSLGLLGMVGMQGFALQSNREARLQSVGYGLAQELAEMMRGNKDVALQVTATNPYRGRFTSDPLVPATAAYCLTEGCTTGSGGTGPVDPTRLAQAQMTEWLARVSLELPGARVEVCADAAPYDSDGLPRWLSSGNSCDTPAAQLFIKIGWSTASTSRAASAASAIVRTSDATARPALVFPVIAGSPT